MKWFYAKDWHPTGPVDDEEFQRLIATGVISELTLVWRSGMAEWKTYGEIRPAAPPPLPGAALIPETSAAEPVTQEPNAGPAQPGSEADATPYAGFWIRVAAGLFDALILMPVLSVLYIGFIVAFPDFLAGYPKGEHDRIWFEVARIAIIAGYETWFVGCFAATPGKMICNLRVVHPDGSRITYSRALGRFFGKIISSLFFGAGYILIGLNRQKCALHDFVCDTRVVHTD
jgi:uncharacterized RDD family membrane protein YckC